MAETKTPARPRNLNVPPSSPAPTDPPHDGLSDEAKVALMAHAARNLDRAAEKKPVKTPRERFKALAGKRTEKAKNALLVLARFGNPASYEMHDEERDFIMSQIDEAYAEMKRLLLREKKAKSNGFVFQFKD